MRLTAGMIALHDVRAAYKVNVIGRGIVYAQRNGIRCDEGFAFA
jgi:hypothetical protein